LHKINENDIVINNKFRNNNETPTKNIVDKIETKNIVDKIETKNIVDKIETKNIVDKIVTKNIVDKIETKNIVDKIETKNMVDKIETPSNNIINDKNYNINKDEFSVQTLQKIKDLHLNEQEIIFYKNKIKAYNKPINENFPINDVTNKKIKQSNIKNSEYSNEPTLNETLINEELSKFQDALILQNNNNEILIQNSYNREFQSNKNENSVIHYENKNLYDNNDDLIYFNPNQSKQSIYKSEITNQPKSIEINLFKNQIKEIITIIYNEINKNINNCSFKKIIEKIKNEIKIRKININTNELQYIIQEMKNIIELQKNNC
jgi:hypothetical protein